MSDLKRDIEGDRSESHNHVDQDPDFSRVMEKIERRMRDFRRRVGAELEALRKDIPNLVKDDVTGAIDGPLVGVLDRETRDCAYRFDGLWDDLKRQLERHLGAKEEKSGASPGRENIPSQEGYSSNSKDIEEEIESDDTGGGAGRTEVEEPFLLESIVVEEREEPLRSPMKRVQLKAGHSSQPRKKLRSSVVDFPKLVIRDDGHFSPESDEEFPPSRRAFTGDLFMPSKEAGRRGHRRARSEADGIFKLRKGAEAKGALNSPSSPLKRSLRSNGKNDTTTKKAGYTYRSSISLEPGNDDFVVVVNKNIYHLKCPCLFCGLRLGAGIGGEKDVAKFESHLRPSFGCNKNVHDILEHWADRVIDADEDWYRDWKGRIDQTRLERGY
jgi:hypothetical protein